MQIIEIGKSLKQRVLSLKSEGKSIGFVPTMGALHEGHLALVKESTNNNDITVVSIFVNPNQFNNKEDLKKYPRTLEEDLEKLSGILTETDFVYTPEEDDIYPEEDNREFDFGKLDKVLEGEHRPGHFNGVAQVVSRLFDMVCPTNAYFGEKDYQQYLVIEELVKMLKSDIKIVPCKIVREPDGLAMSSRNVRLSDSQRISARKISEILFQLEGLSQKMNINELKGVVKKHINSDQNMDLEYFSIVDPFTLKESNVLRYGDLACIAVNVGAVRLIDNIKLIRTS
jgi:pantoate--beta-alanine ligase